MEDFKEISKELIEKEFSTDGDTALLFSTGDILRMVRGVIPSNPIDQHDIYEALQEMGYKIILHTFYKKDKDGNDTEQIHGHVYLWELYPKNKKLCTMSAK